MFQKEMATEEGTLWLLKIIGVLNHICLEPCVHVYEDSENVNVYDCVIR